jgi:hypothetical protein
MKPTGEDLYRDRFRLRRPDRVEVLAVECADGLVQSGLEDVEVADHASPIECRALNNDLHPVVVCMKIPLGRGEPGNTVQCPQVCRRADFEPCGHE